MKEAMLTFVTYLQAKHSILEEHRVVEQLQSKWEGPVRMTRLCSNFETFYVHVYAIETFIM